MSLSCYPGVLSCLSLCCHQFDPGIEVVHFSSCTTHKTKRKNLINKYKNIKKPLTWGPNNSFGPTVSSQVLTVEVKW